MGRGGEERVENMLLDVTGTFPWSSALTHPGDETKHVSKASEVKRSPIPQQCT